MLSRKHYQAIAAIVADATDTGDVIHVSDLTRRLADYFTRDNPAFDRAKFLAACGVQLSRADTWDKEDNEADARARAFGEQT